MRIGLLGGTFNPIHHGHLHVAEKVQEKLHLDKILFIPSGNPPHKTEEQIPPAEHRLEMTRLALADHPRFELCDLETRRPGRSYSIDTVRELRKRHPRDPLFFMIGTDAFFFIPTWKEAEELFTLSNFVIVSRPGTPFSKIPDFRPLAEVDLRCLNRLDRDEIDLCQFRTGPETSVYFLALPPAPISASEIRRKMASQTGAKNLLPERVESYIIKNKLYR